MNKSENFKFMLRFLIILFLFCRLPTAFAVTVLAPQSMSYAVTEIIRNYATNSNLAVSASFGNIRDLVANIESGQAADLIITDHPKWIKDLKQKGLVNVSSIANLVEDKMVLVTSRNFYNLNKAEFNNLTSNAAKVRFYRNFTILIPDWKKDFSGLFAQEIIRNTTYLRGINNNVLESANLAADLSEVSDRIAITKYSSVYDNPELNIIEQFSEDSYGRFVYQIAIAASENMVEADKLLNYFKSEEALLILKKYGFELLK